MTFVFTIIGIMINSIFLISLIKKNEGEDGTLGAHGHWKFFHRDGCTVRIIHVHGVRLLIYIMNWRNSKHDGQKTYGIG